MKNLILIFSVLLSAKAGAQVKRDTIPVRVQYATGINQYAWDTNAVFIFKYNRYTKKMEKDRCLLSDGTEILRSRILKITPKKLQ